MQYERIVSFLGRFDEYKQNERTIERISRYGLVNSKQLRTGIKVRILKYFLSVYRSPQSFHANYNIVNIARQRFLTLVKGTECLNFNWSNTRNMFFG